MNYIFDFDGTIADTMPAFIAVFNKTVRGYDNPLTIEEIQRLRGMTSQKALKLAGIRWWQIPKLVLRGVSDFHSLVPDLEPFDGMPETIRKLHQRGDRLFIVTSNTRESVDVFLKKHDLTQYFEDIATNAGFFSKAKNIRGLMKRNNLSKSQSIYIGDETRDVRAARLARIRIVSVTWGFNTTQILKKQRPTHIIDQPKQLLTLYAGAGA